MVVQAEPLLTHAQQLEKAGDLEGAAKLLSSWLILNPGASGSAEVFGAYLRVEHDLPALLEEAGRFLQSGKGVPGASDQFEKIARLYDLAGRIEEARDAYMAAHAEGGPDSNLVSAFLLSFQMNDAAGMAVNLEGIAGKGESAEPLLRALIEIRGGDRAAAQNPSSAAQEALIGIADQTDNPDLALKALWILYQAAGSRADAAGQAAARSKLETRFAAAPETALAAGLSSAGQASSRSIVVQLPAPGAFEADSAPPRTDSAQSPDAAPAASAETPPLTGAEPATARPAPASSPLISVQAGSFLMKENADDLLSELTRRGFSAVIVHEVTQAKDRYRVLAGSGLEMDAAKEVMKRLSDAGFRGFLVQDKKGGG
ncbi:MAG: SPOR domain-containing protein [Spirochaetia bacterium]|jgi:cell division septation protein DedD